MPLFCLTRDHDWDAPFFKVLANNDTGAAAGHQGGIVIPKDLRLYFPGLSEAVTSAVVPTTDRRITAELFVENRFLGTVNTRYQYQTWGGTRSAESRLTDQLGPIRSLASGEDLLILQRSLDRLDLYRLTLVRRSSPDFQPAIVLTDGKRWGVIGANLPLTQSELQAALTLEAAREQSPFALLDENAAMVEGTVRKVARSVAFRESVVGLYDKTCAVCQTALQSPAGPIELDAAHIVPRSRFGADDARNGLALCKRHHWAFDGGLFGITDTMTVVLPRHVVQIRENAPLVAFSGRLIKIPQAAHLAPHRDALAWHRENVLLRA